jgi:hypothetical protein
LNADNPDLSGFRSRGGKLIIDNGWMDGSMSAYGTIQYYERVLEFDPTAAEDVRLFIRPGVTHCNIGPGPDGTDYLDAIDDWVESGKAPEKLPALYRSPVGQATGGGRILCAWPSVVRYRGDGDPKDPSRVFRAKKFEAVLLPAAGGYWRPLIPALSQFRSLLDSGHRLFIVTEGSFRPRAVHLLVHREVPILVGPAILLIGTNLPQRI